MVGSAADQFPFCINLVRNPWVKSSASWNLNPIRRTVANKGVQYARYNHSKAREDSSVASDSTLRTTVQRVVGNRNLLVSLSAGEGESEGSEAFWSAIFSTETRTAVRVRFGFTRLPFLRNAPHPSRFLGNPREILREKTSSRPKNAYQKQNRSLTVVITIVNQKSTLQNLPLEHFLL